MVNVPEYNTEAYRLLFQIENTLRAFITTCLEKTVGPRWFKSRLPADLLEKYKASLAWERAIPWQLLVPHHPLFYLDFPDLRKIIDRKDNWNDIFSTYFRDKQVFLGHLESLESIRNRIAHNRYLQRLDVDRLNIVAQMINDGISHYPGPLRGDFYARSGLIDELKAIRQEATRAFSEITNLRSLHPLEAWQSCCNEWWFDEDYLGLKIESVAPFFASANAYSCLPRNVGQGYLLEQWVKINDINGLYQNCLDSIDRATGVAGD
jgi:Swt1-like HEPN